MSEMKRHNRTHEARADPPVDSQLGSGFGDVLSLQRLCKLCGRSGRVRRFFIREHQFQILFLTDDSVWLHKRWIGGGKGGVFGAGIDDIVDLKDLQPNAESK